MRTWYTEAPPLEARPEKTPGNEDTYLIWLHRRRHELQERVDRWTNRDRAKIRLAHRLREKFGPGTRHRKKVLALCETLEQCCSGGRWGTDENGKLYVALDHQCGLVNLCPHASHKEGVRATKRYLPGFLALTDHGYTPFKAVFTLPNVPQGQLRSGLQAINKRLRRFVKAFPEIAGWISCTEAPLSAHGDWNIHINVVFFCRQRFVSWKTMRAWWGYQLEIRRLNPHEGDWPRVVAELIKYSCRAVSQKSSDKAARFESDAPAMEDWDTETILEFLEAHEGYRRTRCGGILRDIPKLPAGPRPNITWHGQIARKPGGGLEITLPSCQLSFGLIHGNKSIPANGPKGGLQPATGPPDDDVGAWVEDYDDEVAIGHLGRGAGKRRR